MKIITGNEMTWETLPGRCIQKAVGKDAFSLSGKMTMGFVRYSKEAGPMEPHNHAEEILYIIDARKGWIRHGTERDNMGEKLYLQAGMVLHVPELEWHVFGYDEDGFVGAIFFYGQVDNIRPEEILKKR
jgi:hypothetical protein